MKRKLLAILTSVLLLCSMLLLGALDVSAATYGDLTYEITGGEVTITDCYAWASGELVIPKTINGYPVTSIDDYAFYHCDSLTIVTIPDSVTAIGEYAFWECASLASVTIPNSVATIGHYAFNDCASLTSIDVAPKNANYCSLEGVLFSKDTTQLIQFPGGRTGAYTIPDSVTTIGDQAFQECDNLTTVTIPDSVTTIGMGAFAYCARLTTVTIQDSVTAINHAAFEGCTSLISMTIPGSVTYIGTDTFQSCTSLTSIDVASNNANYCSLDGILFSKDTTQLIQFPGGRTGAYTIPDSVIAICYDAFYDCDSLTSVIIPGSVTSIGVNAFRHCDSLTTVSICDGVTTIDFGAFYDCDSLTSVTIPDSVTTIGRCAFDNCDSLTSVTIGDSVTTIGDSAFYHCPKLTSVTIPDSVTTIGNKAFANCKSLTDIYYSGTEADRANIAIETGNDPLLNATWHYNYSPEPTFIPGDVDGDGNITSLDVILLQQRFAGYEVTLIEEAADADGDGDLTSLDVILLQQYFAGWNITLG